MPRINPLEPDQATGQAKQLLDAVAQQYGVVPNLARTLAHSPAALRAYLAFGEALQDGVLPAKLREQIALAVSQANGCAYCIAAHCAIGQSVGLSEDQLADARGASSPDRAVDAALNFARKLVEHRGRISDDDLDQFRRAGFGDAEISEITAVVAWKMFANYFNHVAGTDVDFPSVPDIAAA